MPAHKDNPDQTTLLRAFAPLNRNALGLAVGIVLGGLLFLATIGMMIKEGGDSAIHLELLNQFFWGYSESLPGAFIGFLWGFGAGFALGWSFAVLRNIIIWVWLITVRSRAEMDHYSDFLDHL